MAFTQAHAAQASNLLRPDVKDKLKLAFGLLDRTHQDGRLTREDFSSAVGVDPLWDQMRAYMDFNNDGIIEADEFCAGFIVHGLNTSTAGMAGAVLPGATVGSQLEAVAANLNVAVIFQIDALVQAMRGKGVPGW